MIVLACGLCGSRDLEPSDVHFEAVCSNCKADLRLWQMRTVLVSGIPSELQLNVSELNSPNEVTLDAK